MAQDDPIGQFIALPQDQQMAMLQQLPKDKQDKLLGQVKERKTPLNTKLTRPVSSEFTKNHPIIGRLSDLGGGVIAGAENLVRHPGEAIRGLGESEMASGVTPYGAPINAPTGNKEVDEANQRAQEQARQSQAAQGKEMAKRPFYSAGNLLGQALVADAVAETPGVVKRVVPPAFRRGVDIVAGTGPHTTADLVKDTRKSNATETANVAEKNAAIEEKRKADLQKHFEKTQAIKSENEAGGAPPARKEALNRGVEHLETQIHDDLSTVRDRAKEEANAKYTALNAALDDKMTHPEFLPDALSEAAEKIKGSETEPTILKDMEKKVQRGEAISYRDLQGYNSELGRELQKGTLPGDVYTAFDTLQEAVGKEMQRIADENGLGSQLADARKTWRQLKQTFYDPESATAQAIRVGNSLKRKPGDVTAAFRGKNASVEALAKYDPDLAARVNTVRGYQVEAKSITAKPKAQKPLPKLAEKPSAAIPETKRIGVDDIQQAKLESLEKRRHFIEHRGAWVAAWPLFYALRDIVHGNLGAIGPTVGESAATFAAVQGVARVLSSPRVIEFLTKATPRDIEQIPPDLRGDIPAIVKTAQNRGMHVSPALIALAAPSSVRHPVLSAASPVQ